jgi:hypothetical protein
MSLIATISNLTSSEIDLLNQSHLKLPVILFSTNFAISNPETAMLFHAVSYCFFVTPYYSEIDLRVTLSSIEHTPNGNFVFHTRTGTKPPYPSVENMVCGIPMRPICLVRVHPLKRFNIGYDTQHPR